jgi:hypothetical protein
LVIDPVDGLRNGRTFTTHLCSMLSNCGYHLGDQDIASIAQKIAKLDVVEAKQLSTPSDPAIRRTKTRLLSTGLEAARSLSCVLLPRNHLLSRGKTRGGRRQINSTLLFVRGRLLRVGIRQSGHGKLRGSNRHCRPANKMPTALVDFLRHGSSDAWE